MKAEQFKDFRLLIRALQQKPEFTKHLGRLKALGMFLVDCENSHENLVNACNQFLVAEKVFMALNPSNSDCGPEVFRYAQARTSLDAAIALAEKEGEE